MLNSVIHAVRWCHLRHLNSVIRAIEDGFLQAHTQTQGGCPISFAAGKNSQKSADRAFVIADSFPHSLGSVQSQPISEFFIPVTNKHFVAYLACVMIDKAAVSQ